MVSVPQALSRLKIPEGVTVSIQGPNVKVKGPKGELKQTFNYPGLEMKQDEKGLAIRWALPRKREKAIVGTVTSHINNMLQGAAKGYTYRLKTVFAHFPIKTAVKGDKFVVENFLGERSARFARIQPGVKVEVKAEFINVTGIALEAVSQTAANIEKATKVRNRDTRVFQDGIYIIEKEA